MVRVYSIPGCGPCEIVKMMLRQKGVPFEVVDLSRDERARRIAAELIGSPTAGVVIEEEDGHLEAIRAVSPASFARWYQGYLERRKANVS